MAKKPDLENYVDVAERLQKFHERYPEGSLQGDYIIEPVAEQLMLIYCAKAYRHPADPRPGIGYAWEPIPGLTPYTRGSELMVGETTAWGRALAALGFEVHRGIASKAGGPKPRGRRRGRKAAGDEPQAGGLPRVAAKEKALG